MSLRSIASSLGAIGAISAASALGLAMDPTVVEPTHAAPPSAVQAPLDVSFPSYGFAHERYLGTELAVNGQSVDLRYFNTDDAPEVVADHYEAAFKRISPLVFRRTLEKATYVGVQTDDGRTLSVTLLAEEDGSTMVVPGVNRGAMRPGAELDELPVPIPESHENLLTSRSTDAGKFAVSAQFTAELDALALQTWYEKALEEKGFTALTGGIAPNDELNRVLRYRGQGYLVSIGIQGLDNDVGSVVYVLAERNLAPVQGIGER